MTAFGGVFQGPKLEGVEGSEENGERARILGLDLESGVVRVRPADPTTATANEAPDPPDRSATPSDRSATEC